LGVLNNASVSNAYLAVDRDTSCLSRWIPRLHAELIRCCRQGQQALKVGDSDLASIRLRKATTLADQLASIPGSGLESVCMSLGELLAEAMRYRRLETLGQIISLLEVSKKQRLSRVEDDLLIYYKKGVRVFSREWTG
jgi:hypothetical protein